MNESLVLGSEYDDILVAALLATLREMGAELKPAEFAHAGSQDFATRRATLNGKRLTLEAETYMGLTISGDRDTVLMIAERVRERLRK
jgi:hypothetical protein